MKNKSFIRQSLRLLYKGAHKVWYYIDNILSEDNNILRIQANCLGNFVDYVQYSTGEKRSVYLFD